MQLKQPRFTYSACGPFTKNKERIQKFMQTRNINYICINDKTCFHDDVAYRNYKDYTDLLKTTESDKLLRDGAFKISSNTKYDGYERGLASMVYKFFDKNLQEVLLNIWQINNLQMNFISQLLENLKDVKSILILKAICS